MSCSHNSQQIPKYFAKFFICMSLAFKYIQYEIENAYQKGSICRQDEG